MRQHKQPVYKGESKTMQIIIIVVIGHFPSNSLFISDMSPIVDKKIPEGKHANPCRDKTNELQTLS